jgi:hypothetical protein
MSALIATWPTTGVAGCVAVDVAWRGSAIDIARDRAASGPGAVSR